VSGHRFAYSPRSPSGHPIWWPTISMDGRGRYLDNIFIEPYWRSLKQEAVYLQELADGFVAERVIGAWITFYNKDRPHTALEKRTPGEAYLEGRQMKNQPDCQNRYTLTQTQTGLGKQDHFRFRWAGHLVKSLAPCSRALLCHRTSTRRHHVLQVPHLVRPPSEPRLPLWSFSEN